MRNAGLEEAQAGIKIAGRNINNLRYANNTTLMAESEEDETLFFSLVFTFKKKYKLRRGVSVCGPEVCAMSGPHCRRMRHHGPFGPGFEDVTATPIKPAAISSTLLYTSLSMFFRAELAF